MITTSQFVHPDLWLPIHLIHPVVACTTSRENPTLAGSPNLHSLSVDLNNFRPFVDTGNGARPDITN
jgi:hypothetical protein